MKRLTNTLKSIQMYYGKSALIAATTYGMLADAWERHQRLAELDNKAKNTQKRLNCFPNALVLTESNFPRNLL